jgi:hypothetical protein
MPGAVAYSSPRSRLHRRGLSSKLIACSCGADGTHQLLTTFCCHRRRLPCSADGQLGQSPGGLPLDSIEPLP